MLYYLLTYDYLTIRSPYAGYELGYQQANIGPEALLSPQMRDRTKATIESEWECQYENTRMPETSYETGWYIKWQGIKVQDSTVITEGGQISQVKP